MPLYSTLTTGVNLSQLISPNLEQRHQAMRSHERGASEPTVKIAGQFWVRTDEPSFGEVLKYSANGTSFALLMDLDHPQINRGGTIAFAANQPMGNNKLTGLAAGTTNGDSVRFEQPLMRAGGQMVLNTGIIDMNNSKVTGLPGPIDGVDAARKFYVDDQVSAAKPVAAAAEWNPLLAALTVTLGWQPKCVIAMIERMNPSVATPGNAIIRSTSGLFVAGTGSEAARVIHGGTGSPFTTPTFETLTLTYTATGFTLQTATAWQYVRVRYMAWRT